MGRIFLTLAAGLLLAACREDAPIPVPEETPALDESAPIPLEVEEVAVVGARAVTEETDDFLFDYSYPAEAGDIPELAKILGERLDLDRADIATQAAEARQMAREDGFPFNKFSSGTKWKLVADTPGYLSLSADMTLYSGGAHGIYGYDSLIWDKAEKQPLVPEDFFASVDDLDLVLAESFCDLLNKERALRRGEPVDPESGDMYDQCVPLSDTTLLLGSTSGNEFDRIGVQIGPYVAGSYAEGSFEFTFPVTDAVIGKVKEEYRPAFASRN